MADRKNPDLIASMNARERERPGPTGEVIEAPRTTAGEPFERPEVAVQTGGAAPDAPDAPDDAAKTANDFGVTPGVLYRVHGGSAHVTSADGSDRYHPQGTYLLFRAPPRAFEGSLTVEHDEPDATALQLGAPFRGDGDGTGGRGYAVVSASDLLLARMTLADRLARGEDS